MDKSICYVRFVGGPADGLVLRADRLSFQARKKLTLPASPSFETVARHEAAGLPRYRSAYRQASPCRASENGCPRVNLQYDFWRFETPRGRVLGRHRLENYLGGLHALQKLLGRCRGSLIRWLLAPVAHPLVLSRDREGAAV